MIQGKLLSSPILLFGGSGQVGWELSRCLSTIGRVVAVNRSDADLTDASSIVRSIRQTQPSVIVNAAAYTDVEAASLNSEEATAVNAMAPGVMAEEAKRLGALLVHYSTDYVFDGRPADGEGTVLRPYREDDAPAPLNVYGESKLAGEGAISAVSPMHLILRTGWVYSLRRRNFLLKVRDMTRNGGDLRIVDDQVGSPTCARPVAEATARILTKCIAGGQVSSGGRSGCYHLTATGMTSWHDFARAILETVGALQGIEAPRIVAISSCEYPAAQKRPAYSVLDNGAVNQAFGVCLSDWRTQLNRCLRGPD